MLTTERILTVVFASLYRLKTLDMKLFRGKGVRDSELPRTYFLSTGSASIRRSRSTGAHPTGHCSRPTSPSGASRRPRVRLPRA